MDALKGLEKSLGDVFKGFPPLPKSAKEGLVTAWPWLALIFGLLQLAVAWGLYNLTKVVNAYGDFANQLSRAYGGGEVYSSTDKTIIYVGIAILAVEAVIFLMAFPKLQQKAKAGWNLLFLGSLINVAYAVVTIFIDGRGIGSFIGSLVGSAIGFYLLFQVHEYYGGHKKVDGAPRAPAA